MSPDTNTSDQPSVRRQYSMCYVEFGVVLVAEQIDPNTVGESFLRQHSIIEEGDVVSEPPILTPAFSRLVFRNRLSIVAEPSRLLIGHRGDQLKTDSNRSCEIALKYLDAAPLPRFTALGVNFKSVIPNLDGNQGEFDIVRFFKDEAKWVKFGDVMPELIFKATYSYNEKTINLEVGKTLGRDGRSVEGTLHTANFHRSLDFSDIDEMKKQLVHVLQGWKRDLADIETIIGNIYEV